MHESPVEPKSSSEFGIKLALRGAEFCVILGLIAGVYGLCVKSPESLGKLASLGSYLQGAVASLWSLAGFLLIYVAFNAQRQQFQLQHDSLRKQVFESSFFQLLQLHNQNTAEMRIIVGPVNSANYAPKVDGKGGFQDLYNPFHNDYQSVVKFKITQSHLGLPIVDEWENLYTQYHEKHQQELSHYFRTLYHVIKYVDRSDIPDTQKPQYTSLVRAQLSAYELVFLFYNGLSKYGKDKFKPLIERYHLLEHLDKKLLLDPLHKRHYEDSAFESESEREGIVTETGR